MAIERDVNTPSGETKTLDFSTLSPEQLEQELAVVLSRGQVNSRLDVPLPADVHGEWVYNDVMEIRRKQALGFQIDDKYAVNNAMHSDGSGKPIIGDVIFMTCPKIVKTTIDKIQAKRYEEIHGNKRSIKDQQEEKEFKRQAESPGYILTDPNVAKVSSQADVISGETIQAAKAATMAAQQSLSVDTTGGK